MTETALLARALDLLARLPEHSSHTPEQFVAYETDAAALLADAGVIAPTDDPHAALFVAYRARTAS